MNAKSISRHYPNLTPEQRFRLILAASGRGDDAERDRLSRAGKRITLSLPDHGPYAQAFNDMAHFTFMELVEEAAGYNESFHQWRECNDAGGEETEAEPPEEVEADEGEQDAEQSLLADRISELDLTLALGYTLRTKAEGWRLFCEKLTVPPFLLWGLYPGFDRLQRAMKVSEKVAFVPEGFLRWLNAHRPDGESELKEVPFTAAKIAAANEDAYRHRVKWWCG